MQMIKSIFGGDSASAETLTTTPLSGENITPVNLDQHTRALGLGKQIHNLGETRPDLEQEIVIETHNGSQTTYLTLWARKPSPNSKRGDQNQYVLKSTQTSGNPLAHQEAELKLLNSSGDDIGMFPNPIEPAAALTEIEYIVNHHE